MPVSPSFLDRAASVAAPGFRRLWVLWAALAMQIAIGQVYAFPVFLGPLTRLLGIEHSAPGDWRPEQLRWILPATLAMLAFSATVLGSWVQHTGPRRAMFVAALCFAVGLILTAVAVHQHALWLLYLSYSGLAGIGLGIGYLAPLPTLLEWFPDHPGLATGTAVAGFGAGALIAAPLSRSLLHHFSTARSTGVMESLTTLGAIYFMLMMMGVNQVRVVALRPPVAPPAPAPGDGRSAAWRDRSFWALWGLSCAAATAGALLAGRAAALGAALLDGRLTPTRAGSLAMALAAGNVGGRLLWAALSDRLGRQRTCGWLFGLGVALYAAAPSLGHLAAGMPLLADCALLATLYGGGHALLPAYVHDVYGDAQLGARLGRLLTAWAVAGVVCAPRVEWLAATAGRAHQPAAALPDYVASGCMALGWICNRAVRPLRTPPWPAAVPPLK